MDRTRAVTAAVLAAVDCLFLWLTWGALRNLVSDHRDSPVAVYIGLGVFWLVAVGGAFRLASGFARGRSASDKS